MKLLSSIIFFLILGSSSSEDTQSGVDVRDPKVFSLFTVVTFPNSQCTTKSDTTMFGTCYSASECNSKSGTVDGNCAAGFGVCCTFTKTACADTVTENCTYITNPGYPSAYSPTSATSCKYSVTPLSTEICQIRLDLDSFTLGITSTTGACTDSFDPTGPTGRNPMTLCGTLSGMHVYVEQGRLTTATSLDFTVAASGSATFKIKVTQIECSSTSRADPDCNQWITGSSGTIQSYNWPTIQLRGKSHSTCIRKEAGYCGMEYNQYLPNTPASFKVENIAINQNGATAPSEGSVFIAGSGKAAQISGGIFTGSLTLTDTAPSSLVTFGHTNVIEHAVIAADQPAGVTGYKLAFTQIPCGTIGKGND